jgi:hypothetical protein
MGANRTGCIFGGLGGAIAGFAIGVYFLLVGPPEAGDILHRPAVGGTIVAPMLLFGLLGVFVGILVNQARGR